MRLYPRILIPALALLGACATWNPYQQNYTPLMSDRVPKGEPGRLLPAEGPPQLLTSQDLRQDAIKLMSNGYLPIGRSKFKDKLVDARAALDQATAVGAAFVVVQQKHVGTSTENIRLSEWTPDRRIVVRDTAVIQGAKPEDNQTIYRDSVTTIVGEYETRYVEQRVDQYDQTATFWQKAKDPILGVLVSELKDEERKAIQSNKGVMVKVVVRKSPAFNADLLRGDIIRRFGGADVAGVEDFFEKVLSHAGKSVKLELWRDGKSLSKTIVLQGS